ncbi:MAG: precorrin-6y C5,15-methyltransferase (decarboxylating) subunit CbiE [Gordonia sp. (in: high G+C Gram-positive bacteria)]
MTVGLPQAPTHFVVVGIGADGWAGLSAQAQVHLRGARVVYGSRRQLDLLGPGHAESIAAELIEWGSPMSEHLRAVLAESTLPVIHILASGDPMFHGVGSTIVRAVGSRRVTVVPAISSVSLACARLGWDHSDVTVISTLRSDVNVIVPALADGRRLLVLSRDGRDPAGIAATLTARGFGWSTVTVLEQLGGPGEQVISGVAHSWRHGECNRLNIVAVHCVGRRGVGVPGLSDDEFINDGQITKSPVRTLTVAALRPGGPQLLWDIGSGSGSVAIEWLRFDAAGFAISFERDHRRAAAIAQNAHRHGVGAALTIRGEVPQALDDAPDPDAVFIGGGLDEITLAAAWEALLDGGTMVVNAVTVESQLLLTQWHRAHGGTLRRIATETVEPLGSMSTWRPALPIVQWVTEKPTPTRAGGAE